jgi:large subunit ribosomal protein L22e
LEGRFSVANRELTRPPQYIINASQPANDKIFDVSAFEKFLQDRIKVEGRTNNLGDNVVISQKGDGKIEIIAHNELSGRYLKYLYGTPFFFFFSRPTATDSNTWTR